MFQQIVVCPFVHFLSAIVLSVLLRYTDSNYPFGIFKLFLCLQKDDTLKPVFPSTLLLGEVGIKTDEK